MLLAIDCGNTNTVFAVYEDLVCRASWRTSTNTQRTADEYAVWLQQLMSLEGLTLQNIDDVAVSTVVPDSVFNLKALAAKYFDVNALVVGAHGVDPGIDIRIDHPQQAGADRIADAVGAHDRYAGPLVVIDFGTATTFDVIEADGGYAGGIIAPGINLSLDELYRSAAQLPRIAVKAPRVSEGDNTPVKVIGRDTISAMHNGIFWGYIGLIEGLVSRIKAEYGTDMRVIGTGGLAALFSDCTDAIDQVDEDLTLHGLVLIHRLNRRAGAVHGA